MKKVSNLYLQYSSCSVHGSGLSSFIVAVQDEFCTGNAAFLGLMSTLGGCPRTDYSTAVAENWTENPLLFGK